MRDVARMAGVSLKTVSRVVNDEPGVSPVTAARVHRSISYLGFRRNDIAHTLRKQVSSATVGLVIEDLGNPFYSQMARAVESVATEHDFMLIAVSSEEDPDRERNFVAALIRRRVDGLLVVPASNEHAFLTEEMRMGMPVVFLDRPPLGFHGDTVLLDNRVGARTAVEHLIAQGHRRIAMVGDLPRIWTAIERHQGYVEALRAHGLPEDPSLVRLGSHDTVMAEAATRELLATAGPTAIFAGNNRSCIGVLRSVAASQRQVAVIGFDDFELADMLVPPATVIASDPAEMGRVAAELLFSRLAGEDGPPQRVVLPVRLICRGSGEIRPQG
ncbi:MAG TPA: LacI family DNA-binding transcriptional regulator [Candidatus Dormibacteraeota bacterium]|nr:LacI family DNA-binding transcriptional regulator [Candidatus Dormibacteraeota bacterium]